MNPKSASQPNKYNKVKKMKSEYSYCRTKTGCFHLCMYKTEASVWCFFRFSFARNDGQYIGWDFVFCAYKYNMPIQFMKQKLFQKHLWQ